jgi:hypothetical protein
MWIVHGTIDVPTRKPSSSSLLHTNLIALGNLAFKLLPANLLALGQGDVERFAANHLVVHLGNSLGSFLRSREAYKSESLGSALLITHNLCAGNRSEDFEFRTKLFIVNVVLQILDVKVDTLILAQLLHFRLLIRAPQLLFTFGLLLSSGHK